jgi:hypothetical protein
LVIIVAEAEKAPKAKVAVSNNFLKFKI